jgi:PTS system galactitol-specific IIB component
MKKLRVLVACGAGIATSTVVMKKVEDLFKENDIAADFIQIKIAEAASKQDEADMLISTTVLPTTYKIPAIKAMGFLTGINQDQLEKQIIETAKKLRLDHQFEK